MTSRWRPAENVSTEFSRTDSPGQHEDNTNIRGYWHMLSFYLSTYQNPPSALSTTSRQSRSPLQCFHRRQALNLTIIHRQDWSSTSKSLPRAIYVQITYHSHKRPIPQVFLYSRSRKHIVYSALGVSIPVERAKLCISTCAYVPIIVTEVGSFLHKYAANHSTRSISTCTSAST